MSTRFSRSAALSVAGIGAGALLVLAAPLAASAHVTVTPSGTAAGSYTLLTFATSHGCEGSPTTAITINLPENIYSVAPTVNPGWDVTTVSVPLDTPVETAHGATLTERESQVVYTAKEPLADGLRDSFTLQLQLPEDAEGQTLEFPVVQTCVEGETLWDQTTVDGEEEPDLPAPFVTVTAAEAGHGHGGHGTDESESDEHSDGHSDETSHSATLETHNEDTVARVLGIAGLLVGAAGIVVAIMATRRRSSESK